ncbi:hypothetical protein LTR36_009372 [Oleoguttula mirabilis]|uniref:PH domain-like protein n=1 Tax=Oleoguttula mirabilis TaxID=1507867 RepID=A0AAV9JSI2_9PEZI|nr:hypothetical protein LTR36_009372 [Oleoguttula mirabilis]
MPPKRRTTRAAQLQPQPAQSDYDTETVDATETAPTLDPPPQRTNTELNLTVLRRYCPDIEHIVSIAPFAVIYAFSPDSQQWEKCGIEGTLFICQLTGARYNAVILNRKSLDNFIKELVSADDVEITEQYVILQAAGEDGTPQIYGLWIFSDGETQPSTREIIAQTIQSCAMQAQIAREVTEGNGTNGLPEEAAYGLDGTAEMQEQLEEEEAVSQEAGQQVDLLQLFGSTSAQSGQHTSAQRTAMSSAQDVPPTFTQPSRFISTADTDFFRGSGSPAVSQQQQRVPPPTQQNALLGLFKGTK